MKKTIKRNVTSTITISFPNEELQSLEKRIEELKLTRSSYFVSLFRRDLKMSGLGWHIIDAGEEIEFIQVNERVAN